MLRNLLITILIFLCSLCFCELPSLTSKDVNNKIHEILKAHVTHKSLDSQLIERILRNYIDELDPGKTYFIESDIQDWLYPTEELKIKFLNGYNSSNYTAFDALHDEMISAIDRRNELEEMISQTPLIQNVDPQEFNNITWATSRDELFNRLLKIKSLQLQSAEKFNNESTEQIIKRIDKRRQNKETEIQGNSPDERNNMVLSTILKATANALDSHTNYFTPGEAKQFMIQVQQRLFGIGAVLRDNLNGFSILRIMPESPADKSKKLKISDLIIAVDDKSVVGMDISDAVEYIRGEKGTKVKLTILRENLEKELEKFDVYIDRGEIVIEESRFESSYEPYGDGIIAHIKLFSFYQDPNSSSAQDLQNILDKMQREHKLKGVILDLRNNTGGVLPQAVSVTGLFITKGIIASIKDNSGNIQHLRDTEGKVTWDGPLIVLTNKASASAAEIVTQTLQDYGRAIIVGDEKTFGKGSFQTFTLDASQSPKVNPKGEYKVTRGLYYTVSGKSPQLVGVPADIVVPGILSQLDVGEEYSKYPLDSDEIGANFEDDLSDIPIQYRNKLGLLYKHNLQQVLSCYTQYKDALKENSKYRIDNNKLYQNFITEITNKNFDSPIVEMFGESDLQLTETLNIMKDLIYFIEIENKNVACY